MNENFKTLASYTLVSCLAFFATAVLVTECTEAQDSNWAQWRGPSFDSIAEATNLPAKFNKEEKLIWRLELPGPGGASPIVWDDATFVTSVNTEDESLVLICVNKTGEVAWKKTLQGSNRNIRMDRANSASPSPSTDGEHVWANTSEGFIECFDMDGNAVWSVDLQERYGEFNIQFGMSSTPILDDGRLYLQMIHGNMREDSTSVGTIVALDAKTGEEVWQHERKTDGYAENKHSYASPIIVRDGENQFLVSHGGDYIIGHSLDDGQELWRRGGINPQGSDYNPYLRFVASPTFRDGQLITPSAKNGPVLSLKTDLKGDVTDDENATNWINRKGTPDVASPVIYDGLVFLARENGVMSCVDATTGELIFKERMLADKHRSTPVIADGKLFVTGRDGTVVVLAADRSGEILAENELDEETTASPAIAKNRIYIRTNKALYCFGTE